MIHSSRKLSIPVAAGLLGVLLGVLLSVLLGASSAVAATYQIDASHTTVSFKVKHLGLSNVRGLFKNFEGTIDFDPANIKASSTTATIKTASVDTAIAKRDDHLKADDFLAAAQHPEMKFVSKEIKDINEDTFTIVGDLTIRGITKTVELETKYEGAAKDPWGKERVAFSAETEINRKDFGLMYNDLLEAGGLVVGEKVEIEIELEGIKQ